MLILCAHSKCLCACILSQSNNMRERHKGDRKGEREEVKLSVFANEMRHYLKDSKVKPMSFRSDLEKKNSNKRKEMEIRKKKLR